jgi:hypothetical protein
MSLSRLILHAQNRLASGFKSELLDAQHPGTDITQIAAQETGDSNRFF